MVETHNKACLRFVLLFRNFGQCFIPTWMEKRYWKRQGEPCISGDTSRILTEDDSFLLVTKTTSWKCSVLTKCSLLKNESVRLKFCSAIGHHLDFFLLTPTLSLRHTALFITATALSQCVLSIPLECKTLNFLITSHMIFPNTENFSDINDS